MRFDLTQNILKVQLKNWSAMKILICGFMGAGKSTLLKKFQANKLGFDCIDLNHALAVDLRTRPERLEEWILENGYPQFRDLERSKIKMLLRHSGSMVIALGAGTLTKEILELIDRESECKLVFLDTSFEVCLDRIKDDPTRPLSKMPPSELKKLYDQRRVDYLHADLVLEESEIKEIEGLGTLVHNLGEC